MRVKNRIASTLAKKFALGLGIATLLPLTVHYAVKSFSPPPKLEEYQIEDFFLASEKTPEEQTQMMEKQMAKEKKRKEQEKRFEKHLFFVATPMGILAIILGALTRVQAVGVGLMFGGLFSLTDGVYHFWSDLLDPMRFIVFLLSFVILLFIGFKKFIEQSGKID